MEKSYQATAARKIIKTEKGQLEQQLGVMEDFVLRINIFVR